VAAVEEAIRVVAVAVIRAAAAAMEAVAAAVASLASVTAVAAVAAAEAAVVVELATPASTRGNRFLSSPHNTSLTASCSFHEFMTTDW